MFVGLHLLIVLAALGAVGLCLSATVLYADAAFLTPTGLLAWESTAALSFCLFCLSMLILVVLVEPRKRTKADAEVRDAWLHMADLCQYGKDGSIVYVNKQSVSGLCYMNAMLWAYNRISERVYNEVRATLRQRCREKNLTYLWPLTPAGWRQRAEFCYSQAQRYQERCSC